MSAGPVPDAVPEFTFDGRAIAFQEGDTLGVALHRAGVRVLSRSMKYHRPRGLYCCTGSCASCLVGVDGVPNITACTMRAKEGVEVRSQNRIGSAKRDLLGIVDKVYRGGFDPHAAFTRPRILNQAFLKAVRFMSGVGEPPARDARPSGAPRRHRMGVHHLVVGAGTQGMRAVVEHARKDKATLLVDELDEPGGSALWDPTEDVADLVRAVRDAPAVETWTGTVAFGVYGDVVALRRGDDLWEIEAERITIAPGTHDGWPLFGDNDLPGVLSLRGARRLLHHGVLPGSRVVGHGRPLPTAFVGALEACGGEVVAEGDVARAHGGNHVEQAVVSGRRVPCDAIVCNIPGTPRVELFQQAGCELGFQDGVLAPRAKEGRTSRKDVFAAFSEAP